MLEIFIEEKEYFNSKTNEFFTLPQTVLMLEHSLASISAWESKWGKPFLSKDKKTINETRDYIKCMVLNPPDYIDIIINNLSQYNEERIAEYIDNPMTATWFSEEKKPPSRKIITSEIIYYWMVAQNIPFECQYWNLNKLLTLIKVCNIENSPKKKMNKLEELKSRRSLNAARRSKLNSKG